MEHLTSFKRSFRLYNLIITRIDFYIQFSYTIFLSYFSLKNKAVFSNKHEV